MFELGDIDFGTVITSILRQEDVTDLMIWDDEIWVTDIRRGHYRIDLHGWTEQDVAEMTATVSRLPRQVALRMKMAYNDSDPILDGEGLFPGIGQLRFNVIHENLTATGRPALAIRKSIHRLRIDHDAIIATRYADERFLQLMQVLVDCGCNIIIAGETGSGKTELLRYLARWIRPNQAIITIEDTLEAYLKDLYPDHNVLALKATAVVGIGDLLRPCLRQNPDWICVSETRGREVNYLLEAVSTGHRLLSTIHTNSAANIPLRMLEMSGIASQDRVMLYRQIFNHIDIGIYISYRNDDQGSHRRVAEVAEFYLGQDMEPVTNALYTYDFKDGRITYGRLSSPKVFRKAFERQTSLVNLQGVFV